MARKYEPEIVEFARDIIKTRSYSTQEKDLVMLIESKMEALDFDEVKVNGTANIIGRVGNGPRKILYDAHIDTVWAEDKGNWKVDRLLLSSMAISCTVEGPATKRQPCRP